MSDTPVVPDRDTIARALAVELGCVRVRDDNSGVYYCAVHNVGWLNDVSLCARPDRLARAVLAVCRTEAPVKAEAWDEGYRDGINDERTSQDWTGGTTAPNRANPYRIEAGGAR